MPAPGPSAPLLLVGSPRAGGNSDAAALLLSQSFTSLAGKGQAGGASAHPPVTLYAREYSLHPCTGCGACNSTLSRPESNNLPFMQCPWLYQDESREIMHCLINTPALCIISPIYNYHLPSGLKALLDRLQPYWHLEDQKLFPSRPCFPILIAGRFKGEKLFEGSLLTLKYALAPLGFYLESPLLLRGVDAKFDLETQIASREAVISYAGQLAPFFFPSVARQKAVRLSHGR